MKPGGGGGTSPGEQHGSSLVVQLNNANPSPHTYGCRGGRSSGVGGGVASRHILPISPTGPRFLPARNISALARPISKMINPKRGFSSAELDGGPSDDFLEGIVEKKPRYNKHLPLSYQYVMQDHNYCAPLPSPPITTPTQPKAALNGLVQTVQATQTQSLVPPNGVSARGLATGFTVATRPGRAMVSAPEKSAVSPQLANRVLAPTPLVEESDLSSDDERKPTLNVAGDDGEETETAPEDEDSVTRCICEFQHDDGYMICCDKCLVWQHVDCMGLERGNIPDEYRCEECEPRRVDKTRAVRIQLAKRAQFNDSSDSVDSRGNTPPAARGGARKTLPRSGSRANPRKTEKSGKGRNWKNESKKVKHKPKASNKKRTTINKKSSSEKKESLSSLDGSPPPISPTTPGMAPSSLRQWVDSYEEAVTNHYSQELRARIAAIKFNGASSDIRLPSNFGGTPKCRVTMLPSGMKVLVANVATSPETAMIEVRGKYMLSKGAQGVAASTKWSPYVFHHRLGSSETSTDVCVDTTTYGNDARFVRRSCSPNAEIRHCIEKGALHLYIVSTANIDPKTEITLPVKPGQFCCCGTGDKCLIAPANKRRRRRRTLSENSVKARGSSPEMSPRLPSTSPPLPSIATINNNNPISKNQEPLPLPPPVKRQPDVETDLEPTPPKVSKLVEPLPAVPVKDPVNKVRGQTVATRRATTPASKQEEKKRGQLKKAETSPGPAPPNDSSAGKKTREERKMEAIMKAFERMEKDEARKQGGSGPVTTTRIRKPVASVTPTREKHERVVTQKKKSTRPVRETRSSKALRARRSATTRSSGRARPSRNRRPAPPPVDQPPPHQSSGEEPESEEDEPPVKSEDESTPRYNSVEMTPPPPMSNTCLLVAAAVGPLAPGFKFPKSKDPRKNIMSSWFGSDMNGPQSPPRGCVALAPDFAKKRWLRQAISEDSDSPKQEAVSPTEMAAPPKKRRIARESISSELSFTPPATPLTNDQNSQLYEDDENSVTSPPANDLTEFNDSTSNGPKTPPGDLSAAEESGLSDSPKKETETAEEERARVKEEARVKRKLSISEYRERVKSNPGAERKRPQVTSEEDSEEVQVIKEENIKTEECDGSARFKNGGSGFSAAPTLVEQQREALTDRLRREFGLFLSDDEEEKNKRNLSMEQMAEPPPDAPPESARAASLRVARERGRPSIVPPPPTAPNWLYFPPPPPPPPPPLPPPPPPPPPPSLAIGQYHRRP